MSIKLGSTTIGSLYLGSTKIGAAYLGGTKIYESSVVDPLNPLGLPPYTIRVQLAPRKEPATWATFAIQWTQVSSSPNVWDGTRNNPDWSNIPQFISSSPDLIAILGFNATGITNFKNTFNSFNNLSSVCLFDTSAVTDMNSMFDGCIHLTNIPLFDTSSVTDMSNCFRSCRNVQSGALALYQQASTQTTPPSQYAECFNDCGSDTQTGAAELAQIPRSWGGTADPYNPLNLPAYTLRLKYKTGVTPTLSQTAYTTASWTQVSSDPNVWDCTCSGPNWYSLLENDYDLLEIMGANSTGVTNMANLVNNCQYLTRAEIFNTASVTDMHGMFVNTLITSIPCYNTSSVTDMESMLDNCHYLTSVPLFDTHNVINMNSMFSSCGAIQTLPLFDTSNVTNMGHICYACTTLSEIPLFNTSSLTIIGNAFKSCHNVASGALALYNQMSAQTNPPSSHTDAFKDCGDNTQTGLAELAQIPQDWGGLAE
jgi:surface protein